MHPAPIKIDSVAELPPGAAHIDTLASGERVYRAGREIYAVQPDVHYYRRRREATARSGNPLTARQRAIRDEARDQTLTDEQWTERYVARVGGRS